MAAVAVESIPQGQKEELLCTYASLILHDEGMDITAENIAKLIKASGASVEPFMPVLFARALATTDVGSLLNVGSTGGAGGAGEAVGYAEEEGGAGEEEAPAEEEAKEEEEEEDDLGFSLFD